MHSMVYSIPAGAHKQSKDTVRQSAAHKTAKTSLKSCTSPGLENSFIPVNTPVFFVPTEGDSPDVESTHPFPPAPISPTAIRNIISSFCDATSPSVVEEAGCAVCGLLCPSLKLCPIKGLKGFLDVLCAKGVTQVERRSSKDQAREMSGPVIDHLCDSVCDKCRTALLKGSIPRNALANGLWIGEVPSVLKDLTWVEQMLVSKIRRSLCYAHVRSSGLKKMNAHLIVFNAPVMKVYEILPPPKEDMDEVLAILFTGPSQPTPNELRRLPLLVHRNYVKHALEWLKLNHTGYSGINISESNLNAYPEDKPPVEIVYRKSEDLDLTDTVDPASHSVQDEKVSSDGECPFVVHGISL
ncbi:hypothetical protein C0992_009557 [Termitomyces sp. T32_za158]|nr:hypothetical protein C0992_009557 [Termitomyces sp. T32_za158]